MIAALGIPSLMVEAGHTHVHAHTFTLTYTLREMNSSKSWRQNQSSWEEHREVFVKSLEALGLGSFAHGAPSLTLDGLDHFYCTKLTPVHFP